MHDGMPYGRNQGQGQDHSREVDRQSPTGLIFAFGFLFNNFDDNFYSRQNGKENLTNEKALRETQTLRAGCSKAEPKIFAPPQTPFPRAQYGQNLISWRWSLINETPTYKPSFVRIDARNFELSW